MVEAPRELHGKSLIGYILGYFGIFMANMLVGTFIYQFYVYTINLNSLLTSVGVSFQLIINAIFSIIAGILADNKKPGKFGKRRPFLLYGLPLWVLSSIIIWFPPKCPQDNKLFLPTAIFLWINLIITAIAGASIISVHFSMLPEQSQTHKNREKIATATTFLTIIASGLALMLPLIVQSILPEPKNVKWWEPSGKIILNAIPLIGIFFTIFGLITMIITFFSVDESFHNSANQQIRSSKISLKEYFKQMVAPFRDIKFRKYLGVRFTNGISGKILGTIIIPFLTYALLFKGPKFYIYVIVSFSSKFIGFYIWRKLLKKNSILKTYKICILAAVIASFMEIIFLIEGLSFEFVTVLFIITIGTVLGSMYGAVLFNPPLASLLIYEAADKEEESDFEEAVSGISGGYFGLSLFIMAMGQSFASILIGVVLAGPNEKNPIIITLTLSSMALFYLISLFFLSRIKLEEKFLKKEIIDVSEDNLFLKE
ncbi:MAG: MFS transporter [Candidatus Odinarchaeota archaeon]